MKILLSSILLSSTLFSDCNINKEIEILASKINDIEYISKKIVRDYKKDDLALIKTKMEDCNQNMESSINNIKTSIDNQFKYFQTISNNKDLKEIELQIVKKQKAIKDAKKIMEDSLSSVGFYGLFAVTLKNVDSFSGKKSLETKSQNIITPKAVTNLNKVYMQTITTLDNDTITDIIKQKISGKVVVENIYVSKLNRSAKEFFYLAKVKVTPLEKQPSTNKEKSTNLEAYYIKPNLNIDKIPTKYKDEVKNILKKYYANLEESNNQAKENQETAIETYEETINENNNDIKKLEKKLKRSKTKLHKIYKKSNFECKEDIDSCNKKVQKLIISKVQKLNQDILLTKDNELMYKSSYVETQSDNPKKDIASQAQALVKQMIQTYAKTTSYTQDTVVVNNKISKDTTKEKKDIFRKLEKFYIYPSPTEGNGFRFAIVAKFLVSKKKNSNTSKIDSTKIWKDKDTSLIWQVKIDKKRYAKQYYRDLTLKTWKDKDTGLIWQVKIDKKMYNWNDAKGYCRDLTLDGYSNWKLPTRDELKTIMTKTSYKNDKSFSGKTYIKKPLLKSMSMEWQSFWSSTSKNSSEAWGLLFRNGYDNYRNKSFREYVRCVVGRQ